MLKEKILLPLRQKILLALTIVVGLLIVILYNLRVLNTTELHLFTMFYSFGVVMWLLLFGTLIDLDNNRIFLIWVVVGLIQFCFYLLTKDDPGFRIYRSLNIEADRFLNNFVSNTTTSSLKTLLFFLIAYKFFNTIMKKMTGNCILNTYRQISWSHDTVNREISGLDVVFNILLFAVIIISALT